MSRHFAPGATVVRRDVHRGKIWTAEPFRVISDTPDALMAVCWPGTERIAPATYVEWLRTGDENARRQAMPNLAAGQWELGRFRWRGTTQVIRSVPGEHFSVYRYFGTPGAGGWYVNFEIPLLRTDQGFDTFDLLLDLVADADLGHYRWKDEDDYAQARRLGVIDDAVHSAVEQARQRAVALIEARAGPFAAEWPVRAPAPGWPLPELPPDALTVPTRL